MISGMSEHFSFVVVEDNSDDVFFALRALEEVVSASSVKVLRDGSEALDFLLARGSYFTQALADAPRLVLLDLQLPKLNGLEVLKCLRAEERTRAVPVVVFTTSKLEFDVRACYASGANAFVTKPMDPIEFSKVVIAIANYWLAVNAPLPLDDLPDLGIEDLG